MKFSPPEGALFLLAIHFLAEALTFPLPKEAYLLSIARIPKPKLGYLHCTTSQTNDKPHVSVFILTQPVIQIGRAVFTSVQFEGILGAKYITVGFVRRVDGGLPITVL